ncbi:MAG: PEP-CTERM sorting domain-containing protein [Planctomycetota bacterium]|jgi:hypothetical protein
MNARILLGAAAVLATALPAHAGVWTPIDIGTFKNIGVGVIDYQGDFGEFVSIESVTGDPDHNLITVNLEGLLASQQIGLFFGVQINDTGVNQYGALSPGADVDFFTFEGLWPGNEVEYLYDGPNPVHINETSETLALRVSELDSFNGAQDAWDYVHVSLGSQGSLTALFSQPQGVLFPPLEGPGINLFMSEAGAFESFQVDVLAIPAPGTMVLLGLAGLAGRRRRRRC